MSATFTQGTRFLRTSETSFRCLASRDIHRSSASWSMKTDSESSHGGKTEELPMKNTMAPLTLHAAMVNSAPNGLLFDRMQQVDLDQDLPQENKHEFGPFMAREAMLDEEYWTAAWLRAESHWEGRAIDRYVGTYKRKFVEQEFNAIKRRCRGQYEKKCMCIVAVKREHNNHIKKTILKSIVGTLDLSIRYLLHGETFPGEKVRAPLFCHISNERPARYGYIGNLCVAKSARRQGIASNMMRFALELAKRTGIEQVYVHVRRDNRAAGELYTKMGFKVVEEATAQLGEEETHLLCRKM